MPMMTLQILKSVDFTKTIRYLENETLSLLQIKKSLIAHQGLPEIIFKKTFFLSKCFVYDLIHHRRFDTFILSEKLSNECHQQNYWKLTQSSNWQQISGMMARNQSLRWHLVRLNLLLEGFINYVAQNPIFVRSDWSPGWLENH